MIIISSDRPRQKLTFEHFDLHNKVAIDFDGTLVGHPRSSDLQKYIVNHPEKEFHIITFRTHGWENPQIIEDDLLDSTEETGVRIRLHHFVGIHNISNKLFEIKEELKGDCPEYWAWKAAKCAEIGCTIMIDDMAEFLYKDFVDRGVVLVSPDDFEG